MLVSESQARSYQQAWRDAWPDVYEYQRQTGNAIDETGDGRIGVRIDQTGFERGGCRYTEACNTPFQGLAASGAKRALWELVKRAIHEDVWSVAFIHDEVLAEVPIQGASVSAHWQAETMRYTMQNLVPDVKITAEPALMARWYKESEAVYDSNKRLVPWSPSK